MKKIKNLTKISVTGLLAVSMLTACGGGSTTSSGSGGSAATEAKQEKVTLKFANITKEANSFSKAAEKFGEEINAKSNGRITVELFPGGQMGSESDMMQQLNTGGLDMAIITTAQLSNSSPAFGGWLMPFLVNDHQQAYKLWTSPESMALFDTLTTENVKGLGYVTCGFRYLLSTKSIEGAKDLDSFKMRTTPSPTILDFWTSLKVSPTPMPLTEVYTAMQTGVIDGVDIDSDSVVTEKLTEIAKHMTPSKHMYWAGGVLINKDRWNQLSEEDKKLVTDAIDVAMKDNMQRIEKNEADLAANAQSKYGLTVHELSNKAEFNPFITDVQEKWSAKSPELAKFLEKAKQVVKE